MTGDGGLRGRLLTEPPRPDRIRSRPGAYWLVVATVCIGAGMGQLDASIVSVGLPTLQHAFGVSLGAVEWVALSYLVVLAAAVTAVGRFADMVGRKLLYTYGFAVFTVASVACGVAPNLPALVAFRAVQALGAAMLQANSVALIATAVPRTHLGRAIGIQGAAQAVGLALGPTVGGALIGLAGWRWIFLVNAPAGLVGIGLGWLLLPRSRDLAPRTPFDWPGLLAFAPAVATLLAGLSYAGRGHAATPTTVDLLAAAAVLTTLFVRRERRAAAPMLDPKLFRIPSFTAGIGAGLLSYLVLFGALFAVPFYLERVQHSSPTTAGLELTVLPVALGATAPLVGRVADRVGARAPTVVGLLLAGLALVAAALVHGTSAVVVELAVLGIGIGAFIPANNAAVMSSAPRQQAGLAGGVLNMTRSVGTALGVAVTAIVLDTAAGQATVAGNAATRHGFTTASLVLAAVAGMAAIVAGLRPA